MRKILLSIAIGLIIIIGVVALISNILSDPPHAERPSVPTSNRFIDNHIVIVIDPTIYDTTEKHKFEKTLIRLQRLLLKVPAKSRITTWMIKVDVDLQIDPIDSIFALDVHKQNNKAHEEKIKKYSNVVFHQALELWDNNHSTYSHNRPNSCILNTLNEISISTLERKPTKVYLYVLSDFVESCDGWPHVNLDRFNGLSDTSSIPNSIDVINLSAFDQVTFIKLKDKRNTDPEKEMALKHFWTGIIYKTKISSSAFRYIYDFPESLTE